MDINELMEKAQSDLTRSLRENFLEIVRNELKEIAKFLDVEIAEQQLFVGQWRNTEDYFVHGNIKVDNEFLHITVIAGQINSIRGVLCQQVTEAIEKRGYIGDDYRKDK